MIEPAFTSHFGQFDLQNYFRMSANDDAKKRNTTRIIVVLLNMQLHSLLAQQQQQIQLFAESDLMQVQFEKHFKRIENGIYYSFMMF